MRTGIFFSVTGLLYCIKLPWFTIEALQLHAAMIVLLLTTIYYLSFSMPIGTGTLFFGIFCLALGYTIEIFLPVPLWAFCILVFIVAWTGQFYGHKIEGKKPSFLKDNRFLLIGPMWQMSFVYKKMGIPLNHLKKTS